MSFLNNLTLQQLLTHLLAYLVVAAFHGASLAALFRLMGDPTARHQGRLSLNPFQHITLAATCMAALFQTGWIKPVPHHMYALPLGRLKLAGAALASLALLAACAWGLDFIRASLAGILPRSSGYFVLYTLSRIQVMAYTFAALNLIPYPILTGRYFLLAIKPDLEARFDRMTPLFTLFLILVIVAGWITPVTL